MVRELLKASSALAIVAASVAISMPANAADYGGDCCADLEERVAELEATAVKHGNRRVSMTIGGSVTYAIINWDNGTASDTNVIQPSTNGSGFSLSGEGKLNSDVSVGYSMGLSVRSGRPDDLTKGTTKGTIGEDGASVYIASASMGKLTLGSGTNAYAGARMWDGSIGDAHDGIGSAVQGIGNLGDAGGPGIGYDSPSLAGFTLGVSWGKDDVVGARVGFSQAFSGNNVSVGIGYQNDMTGMNTSLVRYSYNGKISNDASGLYLQGSYETEAKGAGAKAEQKTGTQIKAGWAKNVNGLGNTSIWGAYSLMDVSGMTTGAAGKATQFGVGQDLDAVGATLFVRYDLASDDVAATKDASTIMGGMTVKF
jgi:hypothetical protein